MPSLAAESEYCNKKHLLLRMCEKYYLSMGKNYHFMDMGYS